MTSARPSTIVPTALATLALGVAIYAALRIAPPPAPQPADVGTSLAEIQTLRDRIDALENRQATQPVAHPVDAQPSRAAVREPAPAGVAPELVTELERRVSRLEANAAAHAVFAPPATTDAAHEAVAVDRAQTADDARIAITDPLKSEADKLQAWSALRRAGPDAYTDAVVLEMVRVGLQSTDAGTRADVWRQADGDARSELLVPGLLQALAIDAEAKVREEAAETLANYLQRPDVRVALENAAANDANGKVRSQAMESLGDR